MNKNSSVKQKKTKEEALEKKCPTCGAAITFNPKLGKWKCDYCGNVFSLEELKETSENTNLAKEDDYDDYISYHCNSCGAEIIADKETSATFCVYCGNPAILKSKLSNKFAPSKIIPFKTEKQQAIDAFKNLSKGRLLMPKSFNSPTNIEKIRGVYIPFWLYDVNINGRINLLGKRITHWSNGNTNYTKTSDYDVIRGGTMDFTNVPIDGSTHFDNDIMNTLEPFDYNDLIPYNHAYLSGFYAERYDVEGESLFKEISERALNSAEKLLKDDITGYNSTTMLKNSLESKEIKKDYVLLPVWMVNVKYKDNTYIFAMNGQTGEFIGNIPLDKSKTIIYSIIIFLVSLLLLILGSYILYKIGG